MNYPVWDVPLLGSGLVVAIIAIIHVVISHLAVGGGAFLFVAEVWSDRQEEGSKIRDWLHKYAKFFLLYTTIVGAITGVGIWFSIQLASPEGTSLLIHQFVFAWATEWVMFLAELSVLYLYFYGWKHNSRKMQLWLAGLYFVIAWFSLVIINGILTFMLTPGGWTLANKDIFAGFFNPAYFPSLFIRTLVMFVIGGLGGILVASRLEEEDEFKEKIIFFCAKWVAPAAALTPLFLWWYWQTLPANTIKLWESGAAGLGGGRLEAMTRFFWVAVFSGGILVISTFFVALRARAVTTMAAIAMFLVVHFGVMGGEFFREMARKPYVIYGVLYSNSLWKHKSKDKKYMRSSYLKKARWAPKVKPLSLEHGAWVYRLQCTNCHTRWGYRAVGPRTKEWKGDFGFRWLGTMEKQGVMPPFQGDNKDRAALVAYILSLHGKKVSPATILAQATSGQKTNKPAKQRAAPTKRKATPTKRRATPTKQEAASAKQEKAPVKREKASAKQEAAPAKQEAASVKQEAASAKREAASVKQEAASVKREAASARQEKAPVKRRAAPEKRGSASAVRRTAPVSRRAVPGSRRVVPAKRQAIPAKRQVTPASRRAVPAGRGAVPEEGRVAPTSRGVVPAKPRSVPASRRVIPAKPRSVSVKRPVPPEKRRIVPASRPSGPTPSR